jgi:hypothetical protein
VTVSDAPTSAAALAYRRSQLDAAWRDIDVDRDALLREVCRARHRTRDCVAYRQVLEAPSPTGALSRL